MSDKTHELEACQNEDRSEIAFQRMQQLLGAGGGGGGISSMGGGSEEASLLLVLLLFMCVRLFWRMQSRFIY